MFLSGALCVGVPMDLLATLAKRDYRLVLPKKKNDEENDALYTKGIADRMSTWLQNVTDEEQKRIKIETEAADEEKEKRRRMSMWPDEEEENPFLC